MSFGLNHRRQEHLSVNIHRYHLSVLNVCRWCVFYRKCQLVNPLATANMPLHPHLLIDIPLERIGMDLDRPLDSLAQGISLCISCGDDVVRYPETVPLRTVYMKSVADALF